MINQNRIGWNDRVQTILNRLSDISDFSREFYALTIIGFLLQTKKVDEARKVFSLLIYCIEKHSIYSDDNAVKLANLPKVYSSTAFYDLKLHLNPEIIDRSRFKFYMHRVEEYLSDNKNDGYSTWYYEVDENFDVIRQIVKYDNLSQLLYSYAYFEDDYGGLAIGNIKEDYLSTLISISFTKFELVWKG